jgi:membrane protease YdiL (CAAX protease family)
MDTQVTARAPRRGWSAHWRGHLLLFDRAPAPQIGARAGARLLVAGIALELARLAALVLLGVRVPLLVFLPAWLALALWVAPRVSGVRLRELGLRPWREWTATERSYFVQIVVLASVVFCIVLRPRAPLESNSAATLASAFVPYLAFGFYQELVYRGMFQLELSRRFGAIAGVLAANVLYTFGPLHWHYFETASAVTLFAATFAIGLFFGAVYHRSGNLWLPAVFHAVGNAHIVWATARTS